MRRAIRRAKQISIRGLSKKAETWLLSAHSRNLLSEWIEEQCETPPPHNSYRCITQDHSTGVEQALIVSAPSAYVARSVIGSDDITILSIRKISQNA